MYYDDMVGKRVSYKLIGGAGQRHNVLVTNVEHDPSKRGGVLVFDGDYPDPHTGEVTKVWGYVSDVTYIEPVASDDDEDEVDYGGEEEFRQNGGMLPGW